jgi:uncharacterized protein YbbC (DUF1343 family)
MNRRQATVRTGADRLFTEYLHLIQDRRVGVMTNHTGMLSDGRHLVDALGENTQTRLAALFGPEHGFAGTAADGQRLDHATHPKYGVPIYSLYGATRKPTPEMLDDLDVMICDIQDVGARFYTYISTIALVMEAAAENGISVIILDRPNLIRGVRWEGPIREDALKTFVGWTPIPVAHGMTIAELAKMTNDEGWLANGIKCNLSLVPMSGWKRSLWFDETGLRWVLPSPNMPTLNTAIVYPGLCLIEGTNISEGRGTGTPFLRIGAPWANAGKIISVLHSFRLPGVAFSSLQYTPHEIPNVAARPKYEGRLCRGVQVFVAERERIEAVRLGIAMVAAFKRVHPAEMAFREAAFDRLIGVAGVRRQIDDMAHPDEICAAWESGLRDFGELRENYLLYP